jgi:hypothetical protein
MVHTYLALESPTAYDSGMIEVGWPLWVEAPDSTESPLVN